MSDVFTRMLAFVCKICPVCNLRRVHSNASWAQWYKKFGARYCPFCRAYNKITSDRSCQTHDQNCNFPCCSYRRSLPERMLFCKFRAQNRRRRFTGTPDNGSHCFAALDGITSCGGRCCLRSNHHRKSTGFYKDHDQGSFFSRRGSTHRPAH